MKIENTVFVPVSSNGKYYDSYLKWIPEGEELVIEETDDFERADEFETEEDVEKFANDVNGSRELFKGAFTIATGEFNPVQVKKFKKTYEELN